MKYENVDIPISFPGEHNKQSSSFTLFILFTIFLLYVISQFTYLKSLLKYILSFTVPIASSRSRYRADIFNYWITNINCYIIISVFTVLKTKLGMGLSYIISGYKVIKYNLKFFLQLFCKFINKDIWSLSPYL